MTDSSKLPLAHAQFFYSALIAFLECTVTASDLFTTFNAAEQFARPPLNDLSMEFITWHIARDHGVSAADKTAFTATVDADPGTGTVTFAWAFNITP